MTNGDKIRQMSRKELVDMFTTLVDCATCPAGSNECYEQVNEACIKKCCMEKWNAFLQSDVKICWLPED